MLFDTILTYAHHYILAIPIVFLFLAKLVIDVTKFFFGRKIFGKANKSLTGVSVFLRPFIRRLVYSLSLIWMLFLYYHAISTFPTVQSSLTNLMRYFALTALFLFFLVLTPGLLVAFFPSFKLNGLLTHARRSIGLSIFFFALLHATLGFFVNLGGSISSVFFLSTRIQLALVASTTALTILLFLAATSFDIMVAKLGRWWKRLHRLVYVIVPLVLFHAFSIGSHFTNPKAFVPMTINILAITFLFLEVLATGTRFSKRFSTYSSFGWYTRILTLILIAGAGTALSSYIVSQGPFDPHSVHRQGYSKNYFAVFADPLDSLPVGKEISLPFQIIDKRSNTPVGKFQVVQEKYMHAIVVDNYLSYYSHVHPTYNQSDTFTLQTSLPHDGEYTAYLEYSPPDFIENVSVVTLTAGSKKSPGKTYLTHDNMLTKTYGNYEASLSKPQTIKVYQTTEFAYTLNDVKSKTPVVTLEQYLGAFGHLAIISEDRKTYAHVHPLAVPLSIQQLGGPTVRFSTFFAKKGKYKLFAQFQNKGVLFTTDFVVNVE